MSTPDPSLQALLANLRPRSQASTSNHPDAHNSPRDVSMSLTSTSAGPTSPPPPFSPTLLSSHPGSNAATAQNLLNLLNFGNVAAQAAPATRSASESISQGSATRPGQENTFTAADLLRRAAATSSVSRSTSVANPQSPGLTPQQPSREVPDDATSAPAASASLAPAFTTTHSDAPQPQPAPSSQATQKPLFTYKNPFDALRASRPHTPQKHHQPTVETPQQETPQKELPQEEIPLQSIEDQPTEEIRDDVMPDRVKLTPKSRAPQSATPAPSNGLEKGDQLQEENPATKPQAESKPILDVATTEVPEQAVVATSEDPMDDTGGSMPPTNGMQQRVVPVLTFPVKAFVSITLNLPSPASAYVREDGIMEISRLKKEFDQVDRSLAVASSKYITYALVKNGGMRIIRQDDGKDRQIFKHTHDRIFNVAICTSTTTAPSTDHQSVLGTGVSGSVYYATLCRQGYDMFDADELERESLTFPAYPQTDENPQGGVLKTRTKRSSRHPEFFAIGRGKTISIVWPATVMNSNYTVAEDNRRVDVEKFFAERPLQILTGKAGKDFTFSEDDTTIVSLDKVGRLRFWDIQRLVDEDNARSVHITPYIITQPALSLAISSPAEKPWPTSVLFVDKNRPYTKGGALRYVLVGLRQNHTLQLWDIALGKAVQELNLPRENDTDAICSVSYHPPTGMITVGHPTRNSIFFIHLSAPRYTLSSNLSQATFISRVAAKDPDIPKPESTACMSGIREISFAGRGQLRSVELLPVHKQVENVQSESNDALFELYVAHSTGVTCLVINKEDLGLDTDNKPVRATKAQEAGLLTLKDLKLGSVIEDDVGVKSPAPEPAQPVKVEPKKKSKAKKNKDLLDEPTNGLGQPFAQASEVIEPVAQEPISTETTAVEQPSTKKDKKDKKQKQDKHADTSRKPETSSSGIEEPALPRQGESTLPQSESLSMSISGDWLDKEMKKLENGVSTEFKKELDLLYQNIKTDRASQDQASASRQEAVLRVVSNTLNTNVEKTLTHILRTQMEQVVVPSVVQTLSTSISQQITQTVAQHVKKELGSELPVQIDRTLQSQQMLTGIADSISTRINGQLEREINQAISGTVASSMKAIATSTAAEAVSVAETRMADQVAHMSRQHAAFSEKIEQLNGALQTVTTTLQSMMQAQTTFQSQVLDDLRQARAQELLRPASPMNASTVLSPSSSVKALPARTKNKADLEIEEIASLLEQRKYEEGSIKWLQSAQPAKVFDDLFVRYTPDYLATDVTPLVAFSIGVTVANSLATNTQRRLEWIEAAFHAVDFRVSTHSIKLYFSFNSANKTLQDREILELRAHAPSLITTVVQKLENTYVQRAQVDPHDEVIRIIPPLLKTARTLLAAFEAIESGSMPELTYVTGDARGVIM